jgi:hypothetical protein
MMYVSVSMLQSSKIRAGFQGKRPGKSGEPVGGNVKIVYPEKSRTNVVGQKNLTGVSPIDKLSVWKTVS